MLRDTRNALAALQGTYALRADSAGRWIQIEPQNTALSPDFSLVDFVAEFLSRRLSRTVVALASVTVVDHVEYASWTSGRRTRRFSYGPEEQLDHGWLADDGASEPWEHAPWPKGAGPTIQDIATGLALPGFAGDDGWSLVEVVEGNASIPVRPARTCRRRHE